MQIIVKDLDYIFLRKTPIEHKALDKVNVTINQGEYIGIIGQTGSGKTTFIEHLNALLVPTEGQITWIYDKDIIDKKTKAKQTVTTEYTLKKSWRKKVKKAKELRKNIGVVFQFAEYQLFEETIEKDIAFGPRSFGVSKSEAKERAKKYLNLVGLDDSFLEKSPFDLSGGQKRRVALAGILAMEPQILIADEPTAGLDPVGVREILEIFNRLHKQGKTVVIVTHDLDNVLEVTDRVLIFKDGHIVRDGKTYEVLRDTQFLKENAMEPPKILDFVHKLEQRGWTIPKVKSIDDLVAHINATLASKGEVNEHN
ncbi:energy-coupling factor transporter ATPase [Mycoplasmopsis columbinasalis]|uniref:Energy-coupling factor transporter ATP-binding protein EcfA2 n=1 Tax=Mycoplasmopsis columbinasalis TaxID=114880 RepID=A0A449BA33_9BACT|nr:energy-coupling factor transporter ATPase [Mycoplasmopsis columbinasalis]VEU78008.1 cobalt transporter ATP-binding subunit [Mycoplasmopsis columbinasalis]